MSYVYKAFKTMRKILDGTQVNNFYVNSKIFTIKYDICISQQILGIKLNNKMRKFNI